MWTKIFIGIGIVLLVLIAVIVTRPDDFVASRSTTIAAPVAVVFPHVNELKRWEAWSPWAKLDPNMKQTYEGPAGGVGASYTWSGNSQVGEGRNTITESKTNELIRFKLEFIRPFKGVNQVHFTFKPEGDKTVVTWTMEGKFNFISKAIGLVMDMQGMLNQQFDQGLAQLKAVAEAKEAKN